VRVQLTAQLLTEWLRRCGSLSHGAVASLVLERTVDTSISTLSFVSVRYTSDAAPDLPPNLVIKSPNAPLTRHRDSIGEAVFYRRLAPLIGSPPAVRCVAAIEEGNDAAETVILEDLRATHDHPPWPVPPSRRHCELALDALVWVHAQWWQAPALGHTIGHSHTTQSLTSMVHGIAAHLPAFIDVLGNTITAQHRALLERVFASSLHPWLRLTSPRALTVAHGDAHTWNFLFPRSGNSAAYLIDWQLWHVDVAARDLAFFMALHWDADRRRELELPLLKYYHTTLLAHGISSYAFQELLLDYRRCVVRNLTIPILFWSRGMKPEAWSNRLQCALAAYADLQCDELLDA
jgi:hypothetical protein